MRQLYLLRHGKAEPGVPAGGDHDRALIGKGRRASRRMGAFCGTRDHPPTLALCSSARRTLETYDAFCEGLGTQVTQQVIDSLYMGSPETLLRVIRDTDVTHQSIVVIGHNPGLQMLAIALGQRGPGPLFDRLSAKYPPAALAIFETGLESWAPFSVESARLVSFTTAGDLA